MQLLKLKQGSNRTKSNNENNSWESNHPKQNSKTQINCVMSSDSSENSSRHKKHRKSHSSTATHSSASSSDAASSHGSPLRVAARVDDDSSSSDDDCATGAETTQSLSIKFGEKQFSVVVKKSTRTEQLVNKCLAELKLDFEPSECCIKVRLCAFFFFSFQIVVFLGCSFCVANFYYKGDWKRYWWQRYRWSVGWVDESIRNRSPTDCRESTLFFLFKIFFFLKKTFLLSLVFWDFSLCKVTYYYAFTHDPVPVDKSSEGSNFDILIKLFIYKSLLR